MKEFLFNGYLIVKVRHSHFPHFLSHLLTILTLYYGVCYCMKPDLPAAFHSFVRKECQEFKSSEIDPDSLGNNILPKLPALQQVYEHPIVRGAIQSLLGPSYEMHPHRHAHVSPPGKQPQPWHRDSFWGYRYAFLTFFLWSKLTEMYVGVENQ